MDTAGWLAVAGAVGTALGAALKTYLPRWLGYVEKFRRDERKDAADQRREARAERDVVVARLEKHIDRLEQRIDRGDRLLDQYAEQSRDVLARLDECRESESRLTLRVIQLEEAAADLRRRLGMDGGVDGVPGHEPAEQLRRREEMREFERRSAEHASRLLRRQAEEIREDAGGREGGRDDPAGGG